MFSERASSQTVAIDPPSFAERWAARILERGWKWVLPSLFFFGLLALRAWVQHATPWLVAALLSVLFLSLLTFERFAFGKLLDRYKSEIDVLRERTRTQPTVSN